MTDPRPRGGRPTAPGGRGAGGRSTSGPARTRPPRAELVGGVRRAPVIVVIAALLVIGGLVDRSGSSQGGTQTGAPLAQVPVAAPAGALSSSWFCAGATSPSGPAPGSVVIANSAGRPVTATISLVGDQGPGATSTVTVGANSRSSVPENLPGSSHWEGAAVALSGGAAAVEQEVTGPLGTSSSPCATSGERTWYFATGRTAINASDEITLLNPYPTESVVDLSFTTDQGLEAPAEFQALVVPASGMIGIDLGTHLRRRIRIATVVTARTGRVVAWQTQVVTPVPSGTPVIGPNGAPPDAIDPASPVAGVALTRGSSSAATSWTWPDGVAGNGIDEQYVIFNPSPGTAQVQLALKLDQGSATPFTLTVGPNEVSTVISDQEARVPAGVTHSAVVRSLNGVPVVAERTVAGASPSTHTGIGDLAGERLASKSWLFPAGSANAKSEEWLVLYNPGTGPVTAAVAGLAGGASTPISGLNAVVVAPKGRAAVRINDHAATLDAALTVQAPAPLFVERDLYGASKQNGYDMSTGVPLLP
ncbi:MAG: DUF5719 family protein [Actinomycetota bacterium]|nr:DUF5719 family protein [Actinomycetota bacterium]